MARQHVFPVCGAGSKTISFEGLEVTLDNDLTDSFFEYYSNEDKSINFRKRATPPSHADFNKVVHLVINAGQFNDDNQVLVDLNDSDLPNGFLDSIGADEYDGGYKYKTLIGYITYMRTHANYDIGPFEPYRQPPPIPGTVMCVALKNMNPANGSNYIDNPTQNWAEATNNTVTTAKYPFHDVPPSSVSDTIGLGSVQINRAEWHTLMFTGTRWVLLGSNNWY